MATIGKTIKHMREGVGMTQARLAQKADVSAGSISKLENGQTISNLTLGKICASFGISLDQLKQEALKQETLNVAPPQQQTQREEIQQWRTYMEKRA